MARVARQKSESGVYHAMARGVNKQPIFEEEGDYEKFVEVILACKEAGRFELFAYCLMENHFHLVMRPSDQEPLETVFRRIGGRYVVWFNRKYGRSGPLFQGRFKSEPVEDDAYFLSVVRYVVQNPVAAGICASPFDYRHSSAREYLGDVAGPTDTGMLLDMVGDADIGRFLTERPACDHIDFDSAYRPTDADMRRAMLEACGCASAADFQRLPREERDAALAEMRRRGGSIRQVSRLTGVGTGVVRRCK